MKILLIRPSSYDGVGKLRRFKKAYMPFLTLPLIKALTPKNVEIRLIDEYLDEVDFKAQPDCVGITGLTSNIKRSYEIANKFRSKGVRVVLGGHHVTALPDEALQHADAVVIGEAENVWEDLINDLYSKKLKRIYSCDTLFDLKNSIIPDYSSIDLKRYLSAPFARGPLFPIQATRGCPFDCEFCSVASFFKGTFRTKPVSLILKEIKQLRATYYFFVDDNIIGNPSYAKELFAALVPLKIHWIGQFSTTILKFPELVELAGKSGCTSAYIGIENLSDKNLKSVKKINKINEYSDLLNMLNRNGIKPFVSMILGMEDDDKDVFIRNLDFLIKNKAGKAYFYILTPFPGTPLFERMNKENKIITKDWNCYDGSRAVFKHSRLSCKELEDGLWYSYRRFFSLSQIFKRNFTYLFKNPLMYLVLLFYDMYFHSAILKNTHPLSEGGKHRIN
ncbi:MAG: radical SAM protein [Candidatus Omnitrophota bacterium]